MKLLNPFPNFRTTLWVGVLFISFAAPQLMAQPRDLSKQRFFVNKFFDFPYRGTLNYRAWDFSDFVYNVDQSVRVGFNTVQFTVPWDQIQHEPDVGNFDWGYLDVRLDYIFNKYPDIWVMIIPDLSGQSFPPFIDLDRHAMRGIERAVWYYPSRRMDESRRRLTARLAIDSPEVQELVANYYRELARHIRERYGANHRMIGYEITLHQNMESDWWGLGPNIDYSEHAQTAFRKWLRNHYGTIEALNKAWGVDFKGTETQWRSWVIRVYKDFDQIRMTHQTEALVCRVDWLKYKYDSMDRWNKVLRDALKAGDPGAMLLWRGGGGVLMHERTVLFDIARYIDNIDWIIMDDYATNFTFSWVRGSVPDKLWGIEIGAVRERTTSIQAERTKRIFGLGAAVFNVCRFNTQEVRDPPPFDPKLVVDVVELTKQPRTIPEVRKAIYMSTFQTLRDYADFTAAAETYDRLAADGAFVDVITDGVLLKRPEVLKKYTDGIVIPLAELLDSEARAALIRAARSGIKLDLLKPQSTGTLDEHLRVTRPLAEELKR